MAMAVIASTGAVLAQNFPGFEDISPTASLTLVPDASSTLTATESPTTTATPTPTHTPTASPTPTATWTPVVETVIVPQTVVVAPPVIIIPTQLPPPPLPTQIPPPSPLPPPPTPAASPTPSFGWMRFESNAFIALTGAWQVARDARASGGGYRESASAGATLRFPFTGDGVHVIYRAHPQGGRFELILDGTTSLGIVDTYAEAVGYYVTDPFFVESGYHVLDVVTRAPRSGETSVAIDAVSVFRGPPMPTRIAPTAAPDATDDDVTRQPVANIALISQPPPPEPTATPVPEVLIAVEVVVAYDLNRNDSPDPDEGVQGISARMLDTTTNRLLASGLTDERGFVRLQAVTANPVTVVVPYFGETFPVRAGRGRSQSARWTLLLDAGTQPGLIP